MMELPQPFSGISSNYCFLNTKHKGKIRREYRNYEDVDIETIVIRMLLEHQ